MDSDLGEEDLDLPLWDLTTSLQVAEYSNSSLLSTCIRNLILDGGGERFTTVCDRGKVKE